MRLYLAICAWIEAHAKSLAADDDDHPEGDNVSQVELGDVLPTRPEMHIGYGRQSGDDDDGGVYRVARPISMRWHPPGQTGQRR